MDAREIEKIYNLIKNYYNKYLKKFGVHLPSLKKENSYTKDALTLVFLAQGYPQTETRTKKEITEFIRKFYPDVNDVQQARHLGLQKGWYISQYTELGDDFGRGCYKLVSLVQPHPAFIEGRRSGIGVEDFNIIKREYDYRCATCGSKEGEPNYQYKGLTKLTKGHMDPRKPLVRKNIIPQCQFCNRAYRNWWVFDRRGRVIGVADPSVVLRFDIEIQKKIYEILKKKFG
jgi:hypothetical protein